MVDRIDALLDATVSAFSDARDHETRRRWTRDLNRKISEKTSNTYRPEFMDAPDMLERCIYIEKRDEVVVLPPDWANNNGMTLMSMMPRHFQQMQKGNLVDHPFLVDRHGEPKQVEAAALWLAHPERRCIRDAVFALGRERFVTTPIGDSAINLWTRTKRLKVDSDISLFHHHVAFLLPNADDRERFLDWLAHCEQMPHELPHHGWLMFTEAFGVGRNWLATLLNRVWRGEVAPSLDLVALITGSFNNTISCTRLAVVDEVHIGSNQSLFQLSARLRQMMTEETRIINPKYGKMTMEYNTTRWLIFSNHDDALPIPEDDRRFEVVANPKEPQQEVYYERLYRALDDPEFIAGVAFYLANRDISHYNPGARPRMTAAKSQVIMASTGQIEKDAKDLLAEWKAADIKVFCVADMVKIINATNSQTAAFHHVLKRMKVVKIHHGIRVNGTRVTLYAVDKVAYDEVVEKDSLRVHWERILLERGQDGLMYTGGRETDGTF